MVILSSARRIRISRARHGPCIEDHVDESLCGPLEGGGAGGRRPGARGSSPFAHRPQPVVRRGLLLAIDPIRVVRNVPAGWAGRPPARILRRPEALDRGIWRLGDGHAADVARLVRTGARPRLPALPRDGRGPGGLRHHARSPPRPRRGERIARRRGHRDVVAGDEPLLGSIFPGSADVCPGDPLAPAEQLAAAPRPAVRPGRRRLVAGLCVGGGGARLHPLFRPVLARGPGRLRPRPADRAEVGGGAPESRVCPRIRPPDRLAVCALGAHAAAPTEAGGRRLLGPQGRRAFPPEPRALGRRRDQVRDVHPRRPGDAPGAVRPAPGRRGLFPPGRRRPHPGHPGLEGRPGRLAVGLRRGDPGEPRHLPVVPHRAQSHRAPLSHAVVRDDAPRALRGPRRPASPRGPLDGRRRGRGQPNHV